MTIFQRLITPTSISVFALIVASASAWLAVSGRVVTERTPLPAKVVEESFNGGSENVARIALRVYNSSGARGALRMEDQCWDEMTSLRGPHIAAQVCASFSMAVSYIDAKLRLASDARPTEALGISASRTRHEERSEKAGIVGELVVDHWESARAREMVAVRSELAKFGL